MNDKELANAVVALGVGQANPKGGSYYFDGPHSVSPDKFVRDPRVAMALMEKARWGDWSKVPGTKKWIVKFYAETGELDKSLESKYGTDESLPRAIIEACTEALS